MPRDEKLDHLKRVPLFAKMGTRELERLSQLADEVEVGLDRVLAEEGRIGHEFFIVLDGRVMVLRGNTPVRTLGPGDFFGEIALLGHSTRTATVRAASPLRVLVIPGRAFRALLGRQPDVQLKVLDTLAERL
jgi:CRP/FNR family cyclic AMP-dependent transcriptional regulator